MKARNYLSARGWAGLLCALLPLGMTAWPAAAADEAQARSEWQSLFNGKDLTGWTSMPEASFTVTNSNLRLNGGTGWLRTDKTYSNFVFEAEWRALTPGYNSGFFLRVGAEGKPWPTNAWQVDLARNALGALVKGSQTLVPSETAPLPLNQWVKFRIEAQGPMLTLDVDGERAWEYKGVDVLSGYIGIQAEDKAFEFRNLRVMERR